MVVQYQNWYVEVLIQDCGNISEMLSVIGDQDHEKDVSIVLIALSISPRNIA